MMNETEFENYQRYREAEAAKAAKREAEAEAARRKRQEDSKRAKAEQEEWLKKHRPDLWAQKEREKAEVQRMIEKQKRISDAHDKWEASWKTETISAIVREICEATADMNKFTARYFSAFDRPGPFIFKWWCRRLVDAYRREHGK